MKTVFLFLASGAGGALLLEAFKRLIDYAVTRRARTDSMIDNAVKSSSEVQVAVIEKGSERWQSIWAEYLRQSTRAEKAEYGKVQAEARASILDMELKEAQDEIVRLKAALSALEKRLNSPSS